MDSNQRPADYKSAALPTELHQLDAGRRENACAKRRILVKVGRGCNAQAGITRPAVLIVFVANHQIANLRHILHGEADTFSPEAAVLDAAVRHVVDPE